LTYTLDTNLCIRYLKGVSIKVVERLNSHAPSEITVCSVVRAELLYGAIRSENQDKAYERRQTFLQPYSTVVFDDTAAEQYARIRYDLEKRGQIIGPNDLMIAAIALANELTLITHNTREFGRISGLQLEDWEI
jgi:tRNA(fMet)-specific endonuclease VapC